MEKIEEIIQEIDSECLKALTEKHSRQKIQKAFKYIGGKKDIAQWIADNMPSGTTYCEPFAGSASVFFCLRQKYDSYVLNDIDDLIVNFYRCVQNKEQFEELLHKLIWTPHSRSEFNIARRIVRGKLEANAVDKAWAWFVFINIVTSAMPTNTSFGLEVTRGSVFSNKVPLLPAIHRRLDGVILEHSDAITCIDRYDRETTVFYIDPPYVRQTQRWKYKKYRHEPGIEFHEALLERLLNIKGKTVLSGYDTDLYNRLEDYGWTRVEKKVVIHSFAWDNVNSARTEGRPYATEVVWFSKGAFAPNLFNLDDEYGMER